MGIQIYPPRYLQLNNEQAKRLAIVVSFEGIPGFFSFGDLYKTISYGDPGLTYGQPGLVYGALMKRNDVMPFLKLQGSSLQIAQTIEPEQGRGSVSTFTLRMIDFQGFWTKYIMPGIALNEILGNKTVKIFLGYVNSSFPDDFFRVFQGNVANSSINGPDVIMQLVDLNQQRRQNIFPTTTNPLNGAIDDSQTLITLGSVTGFPDYILGPDGTYDSKFTLFLQCESEFMSYAHGDIDPTTNEITVVRNVAPIGNTAGGAATHADQTDVTSVAGLGGISGINPIELALKLMLSGWNGPWITAQEIFALGNTFNPSRPGTNFIHLPYDVDGDDAYGLVPGDYITISGSAISGNNQTVTVIDLENDLSGRPNRVIKVSANFTPESPTAGVMAIRSKYDTFPPEIALQLKPTDVDIAGHELIRQRFVSGPENALQFAILAQDSGKTFIENECYLPFGLYSITRYGRLSVAYTKPPLPGDTLVFLNQDNIVTPTDITWTRALNTRRFYNYITYDFDWDETDGIYQKSVQSFDSVTIQPAIFNQSSLLPVTSKGLRSAIGGALVVARQTRALLARYSDAAIQITCTVNWQAGSLIEVADVVALDGTNLSIPNVQTGDRNFGIQLFEVIQRTLDITTGTAKLVLLSGIADTRFDRYGNISPSSLVGPGATLTQIPIKPSFGDIFDGDEFMKWVPNQGLTIQIHSKDFVTVQTSVLKGVTGADSNTLVIDPPLSSIPTEDQIVELLPYPDDTDKNDQAFAKAQYVYVTPTVPIVSGISDTEFTVGSGDIGKFFIGAFVTVHDLPFSSISPDPLTVTAIDTGTNTVTVNESMKFTPDNTYVVELIGFADTGGAYRIF